MSLSSGKIGAKPKTGNIMPTIPVEYAISEETNPQGRNIGMVGEDSVGKTTFSILFGYLNSNFKEYMGDDLALTKKALSTGAVPEIERILVIETQNKLRKALESNCVERALIKPLIDAGTKIEIINVNLRRAREKLSTNKVEIDNVPELQSSADLFLSTVQENLSLGPEVLLLLDNMSDYYDTLDDMQGVMHHNILQASLIGKDGVTEAISDTVARLGALKAANQSNWKYRNKWWSELLKDKKKYRGWNIDIYARSKIQKQWRREGKGIWNTHWAPRTFEHVDHQWYISKDFNTATRQYETSVVQKGKLINDVVPSENEFQLPYRKKLAGLVLFEHIAHNFLVEEGDVGW